MAQLHEKSQPWELYACGNVTCNVVTFIRMEQCPMCGELGLVIRRTDWEVGKPPDPRTSRESL